MYAIAYLVDIAFRTLFSDLLLKRSTILPHIEVAKRILAGDAELLRTTFLADEFDVLTDASVDFDFLPDEHKILLGADDIDLVRAYEFIVYANKNNATQRSLNEFIKII